MKNASDGVYCVTRLKKMMSTVYQLYRTFKIHIYIFQFLLYPIQFIITLNFIILSLIKIAHFPDLRLGSFIGLTYHCLIFLFNFIVMRLFNRLVSVLTFDANVFQSELIGNVLILMIDCI